MEIRVLRYFLTAASEGSISRAAEKLNLTQPTLSRQLRELEEELGVSLFERGRKNRSLTLTEEGRLLRLRAGEIVELAERTESELSPASAQISGDIFIGAGETRAMRIIAGAAERIRSQHSGVRFHIYSGNADEVYRRLDSGLLDLGIVIGETDLSRYEYEPLPVQDTWGVLMRKDSSLAAKDSIRREDLEGIPLILSQQSLETGELEDWLGSGASGMNIAATYNLIYNASLLVETCVGCALTLDRLIDTGPEGMLCFRPLEPRLECELYLVWKKEHIFSRAAKLLLAEIGEAREG